MNFSVIPAKRGVPLRIVRADGADAPRELIGSEISNVSAADFSFDKRRIATATLDGGIQLWDVDTGRQVWSLTNLGSIGKQLAFSNDDSRLTLLQNDGVIRVWEALPEVGELEPRIDDPNEPIEVHFADDQGASSPVDVELPAGPTASAR